MNQTQRMKFEQLREKYHMEMQALCWEIKNQRKFCTEQCHKVFEQWHQNISLQCTLLTTVKLPTFCTLNKSKPLRSMTMAKQLLDAEEKQLIDFSLTSRPRDPKKFMETEATYYSKFQLVNEFSK